jgi:hypothetical protein
MMAQDFSQSPYQAFGMSSQLIADFDGDDKVDVLGIQYSANPNKIVLQVNNGTNPITFSEKQLNLNQTLDAWGQPATADIDGDSDLDVIIAFGPTYQLQLLKNDGAANFTVTPLNVSGAETLKIADMDGDTDLDIVGINRDNEVLKVFVNDGAGNFTSTTIVDNNDDLVSMDIGDLDQDTDLDIVLVYRSFSGDQLVYYQNNGANSFEKKTLAANSLNNLETASVVDINNDGKLDIITVRSSLCIGLINQGNAVFTQQNLISASGFIRSIATGDFNGDGKTDIVLGQNSTDISWHKNTSNQSLTFTAQPVGGVSPCFQVSAADLDNDGALDLVVSNGEFWWYRNEIAQVTNTLNFEAESIQVFPNPFQDYLQVVGQPEGSYEIRIMDLYGKVQYRNQVQNTEIDLSSLVPGTYLLTVINKATLQQQSTLVFKQK